jgi:hypothetical protein
LLQILKARLPKAVVWLLKFVFGNNGKTLFFLPKPGSALPLQASA